MDDHENIADKIRKVISDALNPLDVLIRSWPADFRVIMWSALSRMAEERAAQARREV